ncbi:hypothetical protein [Actinomadura sp. 21ATH]|uniref:hypothetical protein n=1 Tax=Actinomadura sp. 21ATH TaxID=1735444 RepID=UPI0035BF8C24
MRIHDDELEIDAGLVARLVAKRSSATRPLFRRALAVDDATWARGRGRALAMALNLLPYYRDRDPRLATGAVRTIEEVLEDRRAGR